MTWYKIWASNDIITVIYGCHNHNKFGYRPTEKYANNTGICV